MQKPEEARGGSEEARGGSEEAPRRPEEARGTPLCEVRQMLRIRGCERIGEQAWPAKKPHIPLVGDQVSM